MPYIIHTPSNPRSFITNNPVIYMDARSWGWPVESRPYRDDYCKDVRDEEKQMCEEERRMKELEVIWGEEVQRRKDAEESNMYDSEGTDDDVSHDEETDGGGI